MSTLKVNEITDTTGLLAPVFPAGSAQLNPLANREDKIINGDFGIWQRALSSSATGYVAADRWNNGLVGGTVTQSIGAFALGDILGANNPKFFLRQTATGHTLSSHYALTYQKIESVLSYAGQTITVLGWARRSSGSGNMALEAFQTFGTVGSPSGSIFGISPSTITLSTTWQPFAAVITVPSITGKTLGTADNDCFGLQFWISGGADFNSRTNNLGLQTIGVDMWGIHIRQGTWTTAAAADYRPRDRADERALCLRYYEVVTTSMYHHGLVAGQQKVVPVYFSGKKRTTPVCGWGAERQTVNATARTLDNVTTSHVRAYVAALAAGPAAVSYIADVTADAEL